MAYETESPLINGTSNNSTQTANALTSGVRMNAALGTPTDKDFFAFTTSGAAAITLDFGTDLLASSTNHWQICLLDGNGDYLQTLATTPVGAPKVQTAINAATTSLDVTGLTALPAIGSRFTLSTSNADTTIYTVVGATALSSGKSTLTLDKNISSAAKDAALVFDPAQILTASSTQLTAQVGAAGTYYVEVLSDGAVWSSADYHFTATVQPTTEIEGNDTKSAAVDSNNRLLTNTSMTGALSSATDVDTWVFTTAKASDFNIAFASAAGDGTTNQWKIDVTQWNGAALPNNAGALQSAGNQVSASISQTTFSQPTTFVVTVSAVSGSAFNTGNYTLKVSGTGLDVNDAPVVTMGTVSSAGHNYTDLVQTGTVKNVSATTTNGVALSSLFSVSDPDAGQSIDHYVLSLTKGSGVSSGAYIHVASSATNYAAAGDYGFSTGAASSANIALTAAQMASATFVAGNTTGDLSFALQAFDSSNTASTDNSGSSAIMQETLRVVSGSVGVTVGTPGATALSEDSALANHSTTFTVKLNQAPTADVKVYLTNANTGQLDFSDVSGNAKSALTFTSSDWNTAQTVKVTAHDDGITEGASQAASVNFQVVSTDTSYDGYIVTPLAFTVADPLVYVNHAPTGSVAIGYTSLAVGQDLTATNTLADSDGLGSLHYQWQRSTATGYTNVGQDQATYTLSDSDSGHLIRVAVSYDDLGKGGDANAATNLTNSHHESVTSPALSLVINHAPAFSASTATATVANHATAGTTAFTANAVDAEGDSVFYSLSGSNNDNASFNLDSTTGALTLKAGTDWSVKSSYAVQITASDGTLPSTQNVTVNVQAPGVNVGVQVYDWHNHMLMSGVTLDGTHSTGSDGSYTFPTVSGQTMDMTPTKAVSVDDAKGVTPADAVDIFRMLAGFTDLNGAGKPPTPYQMLAADIDEDGSVTPADAVDVLRLLAGLSAPQPKWVFVNEADLTMPGKAAMGQNAQALPADGKVTVDVGAHAGVVGILRGDVDGSVTLTGTDLDSVNSHYFTDLVTALNTAHPGTFNASQWGIYS